MINVVFIDFQIKKNKIEIYKRKEIIIEITNYLLYSHNILQIIHKFIQ